MWADGSDEAVPGDEELDLAGRGRVDDRAQGLGVFGSDHLIKQTLLAPGLAGAPAPGPGPGPNTVITIAALSALTALAVLAVLTAAAVLAGLVAGVVGCGFAGQGEGAVDEEDGGDVGAELGQGAGVAAFA
ncbi:hypothetical protein ACOJ08_15460, partial [Ornithinimicrobium sp. Y1847]